MYECNESFSICKHNNVFDGDFFHRRKACRFSRKAPVEWKKEDCFPRAEVHR